MPFSPAPIPLCVRACVCVPRRPVSLAQPPQINSTPTPFHLVKRTAAELSAAGFERLREGQGWARNELVKPGGKYFFERNNSTIVAFVVGGKFDGLTGGFKVVGAHSDSPVLKIKPTSKRCKLGYVQVCAAPCGVAAAVVPLSPRRVSGLLRPISMCTALCRACHSPRRCGCPTPCCPAFSRRSGSRRTVGGCGTPGSTATCPSPVGSS